MTYYSGSSCPLLSILTQNLLTVSTGIMKFAKLIFFYKFIDLVSIFTSQHHKYLQMSIDSSKYILRRHVCSVFLHVIVIIHPIKTRNNFFFVFELYFYRWIFQTSSPTYITYYWSWLVNYYYCESLRVHSPRPQYRLQTVPSARTVSAVWKS